VSDAPAVRPGRELSDGDAARRSGHSVGSCGDGYRGARRARGRGLVARVRAAIAPAAGRRRRGAGGQGRVPGAGWWGRLRWLVLAGLGSALGMVAVLAGRVRRRRAPTVGEALGRALAELLAVFQAALARGRGRRWLGSLGGPGRGGGRSGGGWGRPAGRRRSAGGQCHHHQDADQGGDSHRRQHQGQTMTRAAAGTREGAADLEEWGGQPLGRRGREREQGAGHAAEAVAGQRRPGPRAAARQGKQPGAPRGGGRRTPRRRATGQGRPGRWSPIPAA
jgi:hypothetical protein